MKTCSNIKCYGHRSRFPCYTNKELAELAGHQGKKEDLCRELGIRYITIDRLTDIFSILGQYEYMRIGLFESEKRYILGEISKTKSTYLNRLVGMVIEHSLINSANKEILDMDKLIGYFGKKNNIIFTEKKQVSKLIKDKFIGDLIKLFKKLKINYQDEYGTQIWDIMYDIKLLAQNKELSHNFIIISNSFGGSLQLIYPDLFDKLKFNTIYSKKDGVIDISMNLFFGIFGDSGTNADLKICKKDSSKCKFPDHHKINKPWMGYYNQFNLVNLPVFGVSNGYRNIIINKNGENGSFMPFSYIYPTSIKFDMDNCELPFLLKSEPPIKFKDFGGRDNPFINLYINNHPLIIKGGKYSLIDYILRYEDAGYVFISKSDIKKSIDMSKEYYNYIFDNPDVDFNYKIEESTNMKYSSIFINHIQTDYNNEQGVYSSHEKEILKLFDLDL